MKGRHPQNVTSEYPAMMISCTQNSVGLNLCRELAKARYSQWKAAFSMHERSHYDLGQAPIILHRAT